jgi:DNA-binding transcriptional MerR regulator
MSADEQLLTRSEVARLFRVAHSTVRNWERTGTLTPIKIAGIVRFRRTDIEALITGTKPRKR